jgi:hypothetical protein
LADGGDGGGGGGQDLSADALIAYRNQHKRLKGGSLPASGAAVGPFAVDTAKAADGEALVEAGPQPVFQAEDESSAGRRRPDDAQPVFEVDDAEEQKNATSNASVDAHEPDAAEEAGRGDEASGSNRSEGTSLPASTTTAQAGTTPQKDGETAAEGAVTTTEAQSDGTDVADPRAETWDALPEWEVVFHSSDNSPVNVRSEKKLDSSIIRTMIRGDIFIGKREGEWVRLECEPGYVKIELKGGVVLVEERAQKFKLLESGSCADAYMFAIGSPAGCVAAAASLGLVDAERGVPPTTDQADNPEGCFLESPDEGDSGSARLRLATNPAAWAASARPGKSPICSTKAGSCDALSATRARESSKDGQPSLFCFSVTRGSEDEAALVRAQFSKGVGIFGCDSWAVYAPDRTRLGPGRRNSSVIPQPPSGWGPPVPWLSRPAGSGGDLDVLMGVWQSVVHEGHTKEQSWTVKADLDAVFFPSRLRGQLASEGGDAGTADSPALYLRSCTRPADDLAPPPVSELSGALKVLSRSAAEVFASGIPKCFEEVPQQDMDEGTFMGECLGKLGVGAHEGASLGNQECGAEGRGAPPRPCAGDQVVYHPFSDTGSYFQCVAEAQRAEPRGDATDGHANGDSAETAV